MATKFWDELAKGLAGQWTAQKLGPALAFWGGGLLAWAWRFGWKPLIDWLVALNSLAAYVALAEALETELWTGDRRLFEKVRGRSELVRWIGDYRTAD